MPIHILKIEGCPNSAELPNEVVVQPKDTEFIEHTFNGLLWLIGVYCKEEDEGGIIREFRRADITAIPGNEHQNRLTMFEYAVEEIPLEIDGTLEFERVLTRAGDILNLNVKITHQPPQQDSQEAA